MAISPAPQGKPRSLGSKLRDWNIDGRTGETVSRVFGTKTPEDAMKLAKRVIASGQKANQPVELRIDGSSVTVRLMATGGKVSEDVKKLSKRFEPKDAAAKAAFKEAKASKEGAASRGDDEDGDED